MRKWEREVLADGDRIMGLQRSVEGVTEKQRQLSQTLAALTSQQTELDAQLTRLERALPDRKPLVGDALRREDAYRLAEGLEDELTRMSVTMDETIETLNRVQERAVDPQHPLSSIVKVLNAQVAALQWVASETDKVEGQLHDALSSVNQQRDTITRPMRMQRY